MPRKNKPEPWEGGSSDDNAWEDENLDAPEVMPSYDDARPKKDTDAIKTEAVDDSHASRKRGRRDKKKKIEEIEKPRGVDRGLQPEKILAAQLLNSNLYFLVKWQDCLELDVVQGKDMNKHFPEFVIQYYESCVPMSVRHKVGRVPRIAPELPEPEPEPEPVPEPAPEEPPQMPMDVSENLEPPPMSQPSHEEPAEQPTISMPSLPSMEPMETMEGLTMPDMSLPLPEVPPQEEAQQLEVPVN